jgi:hypothetical protein
VFGGTAQIDKPAQLLLTGRPDKSAGNRKKWAWKSPGASEIFFFGTSKYLYYSQMRTPAGILYGNKTDGSLNRLSLLHNNLY